MARPAKVGGLRTTRVGDEATEPGRSALPDKKDGLYQFRSGAAAYRFSVRRRIVNVDPVTKERYETSPRTADEHDAPMDWIIFEDHNYATPSKELAEAVIAKAKKLAIYGVGAALWLVDDEIKAHDDARERELRAMIEARPDIAARVLKPSDSQDFVLPSPPSA